MSAPAIVLVRPQEEGNVGAVARAMANMGLEELVLVEPAPALGGMARGFGVGGWHVLEQARRAPSVAAALAPYRRVVGTTSGRGRQLADLPVLTPRALPSFLATTPTGTASALLFGAESDGLRRDELARCQALVTIPTASAHPTLNLAQAVLILAYELRSDAATPQQAQAEAAALPARGDELDALDAQLAVLLERIGYRRADRRRAALRELRRLAVRSAATSRELRLLFGICQRARRALGVAKTSLHQG